MSSPKNSTTPKRKKNPVNVKPERALRVAHGGGREALLEAVVKVVVREGLSGLSYRTVATEAGVTHGLVHYYFGTKNDMISEAYKWALDTELQEMDLRPNEDFPENLASLSDRDINLHIFLNEMVLDACRKPELRKIVKPMFKDVFKAVEVAMLSAGVSCPPERARLIFATIAGLTIQRIVLGSPKQTRESAMEFKKILGILRDSSAN